MGSHPGGSPQRPALFFDTAEDFREWLAENHATQTELWMGFYRKGAARAGLKWADAVPEALCYGWIDSVAQGIDDQTTRQRWTPRKARSNWSQVNIAIVERLLAEGRMQPAGLAAYERRPQNQPGYSYERESALPPAWEAQLRADPAAAAFFYERATESYRKLCINWVTSAKRADTRERRFAQLLESCAASRLIPTQLYGEIPKWAR